MKEDAQSLSEEDKKAQEEEDKDSGKIHSQDMLMHWLEEL